MLLPYFFYWFRIDNKHMTEPWLDQSIMLQYDTIMNPLWLHYAPIWLHYDSIMLQYDPIMTPLWIHYAPIRLQYDSIMSLLCSNMTPLWLHYDSIMLQYDSIMTPLCSNMTPFLQNNKEYVFSIWWYIIKNFTLTNCYFISIRFSVRRI